MAYSCNVFFGTLAAELGPERFRRAMRNAELKWVPEEKELFEYLPYAGFGQIVDPCGGMVMTGRLECVLIVCSPSGATYL